MIPLTLGEIARLTEGRLSDPGSADLLVRGPAFVDSRTPEPEGLFAAFVGEHVDGHQHAAQAVDGGAAAVLGSRPTDRPTIVVADVRAALQVLASAVLLRLRAASPTLRVVALTGSSGKTTVKDLLAQVLAADGPTVATQGSFNNELGLPLTVLRATPHTRHLVLEMGARGLGHLRELCAIAPPDVALVLNVGSAHVGEFGSREKIAQAKGELVEALGPGGTAVLNADDPLVAAMAARTSARVRRFGTSPEADVQVEGLESDERGRPAFTLRVGQESHRVQLQVTGEHQASNAAAAVAVATTLGLDLEQACVSVAAVQQVSRWRMELSTRDDGLVVLNDAYNANPESMAAALRTLAEIGRRAQRRTVAVVGEMRELGEGSESAHAAIGRLSNDLGVDVLVVVGAGARPAYAARVAEPGKTGVYCESVAEAGAWVRHNVADTDAILVKASRSIGLERVAHALAPPDPDREE